MSLGALFLLLLWFFVAYRSKDLGLNLDLIQLAEGYRRTVEASFSPAEGFLEISSFRLREGGRNAELYPYNLIEKPFKVCLQELPKPMCGPLQDLVWVTNMSQRSLFYFHNFYFHIRSGFIIGDPKAPSKEEADVLKEMGYVGLYKVKGGQDGE